MKKILFLVLATIISTVAFGQTENNSIIKIHKKDNTTKAIVLDNVQDITFKAFTPVVFQVDIEQITQNAALLYITKPENCKKFFLKIATQRIAGTDAEVRATIIDNHNQESTEDLYSWYKQLQPGTSYYFYLLGFDEDDVPCGMTMTTVTTQAQATDEFQITITDIASADAQITVTPKNPDMTYYPFIVSQSELDQMISQFGSIQKADSTYWADMAAYTGSTPEAVLSALMKTGTMQVRAKDFIGKNLAPETTYIVYCYGVNSDGTFTTPVYQEQFVTRAATSSNNVITATIVKTYTDGCDVNVTTTNQDQYLINIQTKETWEKDVNNAGGNTKAAAESLAGTLGFYGDINNYLHKGNFSGKITTGLDNKDCVLIIFGYNDGVTTDVQAIEFRTENQE